MKYHHERLVILINQVGLFGNCHQQLFLSNSAAEPL
jgi:hypothetical protein